MSLLTFNGKTKTVTCVILFWSMKVKDKIEIKNIPRANDKIVNSLETPYNMEYIFLVHLFWMDCWKKVKVIVHFFLTFRDSPLIFNLLYSLTDCQYDKITKNTMFQALLKRNRRVL